VKRLTLCGAVQKQIICSRNLDNSTLSGEYQEYKNAHYNTHSNGILSWMPTGMENLLVEIQCFQLHGISKPSWPSPVLRPGLCTSD
jgi:hypothetical protein